MYFKGFTVRHWGKRTAIGMGKRFFEVTYAITGAPVRAFLPGGSEVVSVPAGVRALFTNRALSEDLSKTACLRHSFVL